jgi:hypothetical protein
MAWAPDYLTLAELKNYVRVDDDVDNTELTMAITAASRAVDDHCNRQFGRVAAAEERRYTGRYDYEQGLWVVDVDDLQDATGLTAEVDGDAVTPYTLEPVNAVLNGKAWTRLVVSTDSATLPTGAANEVTVEALWGWTAVPAAVKQATALQANRLASRRNSPYGVAGSPEAGSELRLLARVDPDVAVSLRGLVRARKVG